MTDFSQVSSAEAGASDGNSPDPPNSGKRKRQDSNGGGQHRAKRNRYISIACNECKRRKIKCNGETPCQRCGNLDLECIYSPNCCSNNFRDSPEFKQLKSQVTSLQDQVNTLLYNLNSLRSFMGQDGFQFPQDTSEAALDQAQAGVAHQASMAIDPDLQSRQTPQRSSPQQSRFQGPTSSGFSLGVAQSSLRNMGIANAEDAISRDLLAPAADTTQLGNATANRGKSGSPNRVKPLHATKDPIWALSKEEALRLCRVFEDETYMMYPMLNMESLVRHAGMLFQFIDAISKSVMVSSMPGADDMQDQDTDLLKLVLATTLTIEGAGRSELGKKLFDNVNKNTDSRLLGSVNIKDIQILTLTALYHFHSDDEGLAWRVIGLTARLCLELGLHRSATYDTLFATEQERHTALKLFWSIYVLDHRWSFGTGMSFALLESDIDRQLPKPTESSPYLTAMIDYCNISSKCWKYIAASEPGTMMFNKDDIQHLDFQIMQWYSNLPEHLRLIHPNSAEFAQYGGPDPNELAGRSIYRQRVLLHLRANQMRIAIYRTILYSSNAMQSSLSTLTFAETAVDVAKDTIRVLTHINTRSDIYKTRQITYNHFLLSALAALFLAVCHAPAHFAEPSRDEFYMALDLVRGLSAHSYVSKRLWRTIRGLKKLGPKIGLFARPGDKWGANGRHMNRDDGENDYSAQGSPHFQNEYAPQQQPDAQRSAAMTMAGLAGHPIDETVFFANHAQVIGSPNTVADSITSADQRTGQPLTSPNGMANELTSLFEAAGAYATNGTDSAGFRNANHGASPAGTDASGGRLGLGGVPDGVIDFRPWEANDDELNKILKELF